MHTGNWSPCLIATCWPPRDVAAHSAVQQSQSGSFLLVLTHRPVLNSINGHRSSNQEHRQSSTYQCWNLAHAYFTTNKTTQKPWPRAREALATLGVLIALCLVNGPFLYCEADLEVFIRQPPECGFCFHFSRTVFQADKRFQGRSIVVCRTDWKAFWGKFWHFDMGATNKMKSNRGSGKYGKSNQRFLSLSCSSLEV